MSAKQFSDGLNFSLWTALPVVLVATLLDIDVVASVASILLTVDPVSPVVSEIIKKFVRNNFLDRNMRLIKIQIINIQFYWLKFGKFVFNYFSMVI